MILEYLAVISNEEERKNEKVWKWKYTFIDVDTKEKDHFFHNKKANYSPKVIGKLKLIQDENGVKFYQSFDQTEFKIYKNDKEELFTRFQLAENVDQKNKRVDK